LEVIVGRAHELGLYSNLVTSGVPLARERLVRLKDAGIEQRASQLSSTRPISRMPSRGTPVHAQKLDVAGW